MPTETREEERRLTVTPYEKYDLGSFTSPLPPVILADLFPDWLILFVRIHR